MANTGRRAMSDVLRRGSTPYMVLDPDEVRGNIRAIGCAFPRVRVLYALKCNPHGAVVAGVRAEGLGFEVASEYEVRDLEQAGVPGLDMMCMHPVKSPRFLRRMRRLGVPVVAVDNAAELDKIAEHCPGAGIVARLLVDESGSRVPMSSKFGCDRGAVIGLVHDARRRGLRVRGLTMHVGSQSPSADTWARAVRSATEVLGEIAPHLESPLLSLGGGLPVRYTPSDATDAASIGKAVMPALTGVISSGVQVTIEPGRAIAASAGTLVTSVVGVAERGDLPLYHLDTGIYHGLIEALEYCGTFRYPIVTDRDQHCPDWAPALLAGQTCDGLDVLPGEWMLPPLRVGDRVAFRMAGAYSSSICTRFNGFPPPRTVVMRGASDAVMQIAPRAAPAEPSPPTPARPR
jgi:ornithine decarboxylase